MKKHNPDIHHRRSIRLRGYDYSQAGLYFVTICCQNMAHLFGKIIDGKMALNDAGKIIEKIWHEIPNDFKNIHLHEYITMPNHIHGIIEIAIHSRSTQIPGINETHVGADSISAPMSAHSIPGQNFHKIHDENRGVQNRVEMDSKNRAEMDSAPTPTKPGAGLSRVVQSFKRYTSIEYIKMVKQNILPVFDKRIWQRNYWEHIIRNENEFIRISKYIRNNPIMWNTDKLNGGRGNVVMEPLTPYNEEN